MYHKNLKDHPKYQNKPLKKCYCSLPKVQMLDCYLWVAFILEICGDVIRYESSSSSYTLRSQRVVISGKYFKSCSRAFLGSSLAVCQAATRKIMTYLTTTLGLRMGKKEHFSALSLSSWCKFGLKIK